MKFNPVQSFQVRLPNGFAAGAAATQRTPQGQVSAAAFAFATGFGAAAPAQAPQALPSSAAFVPSPSQFRQFGDCGFKFPSTPSQPTAPATTPAQFPPSDVAVTPAKLETYPKVPFIGNTGPEPAASAVVESRVTGSEANKQNIHTKGENPWLSAKGDKNERIAVWWALQKNDKVKYDADRKVFFTTDTNGQKKDVATLQQVQQVVQQNGGVHNSSHKAFNAVGTFMDGAVRNAGQPAPKVTPQPTQMAPGFRPMPQLPPQLKQDPRQFVQQLLQLLLPGLRLS